MRRRTDSKIEHLKQVPLFTGLSKKALGEIAKIADEIDLPEGKQLIREDEPGRQFFILLDGEADNVKVTTASDLRMLEPFVG